MRRTPTDTTHPRSRAPRTAFLVGAAIAAPMAAVGVANATVDGSSTDPASPARPDDGGAALVASAGPTLEPTAAPADALPVAELEAAEAFWANGYAFCDAEALARAQGIEVWDAKVGVGARLLAGEAVDGPSGCTTSVADGTDASLLAFWDHGYAYCDAVAIAEAMGTDPTEAKLAVGAALIAGEPVPAPPSGCTD